MRIFEPSGHSPQYEESTAFDDDLPEVDQRLFVRGIKDFHDGVNCVPVAHRAFLSEFLVDLAHIAYCLHLPSVET